MFPHEPLGHCGVLDPILLRPEFWGHFVCQVYASAAVQYIAFFPVEPDVPLMQYAFYLMLPFG